ncbi:hypothetical protein [Microbacterium halotolerans]|uniref:hypothetical protein n=1 Tax=Microbacterium halotolerans TaxID=246613 RepID=UPI000E6AB3B4|nr:hypothetical protein [Microbacterium halotolerans]
MRFLVIGARGAIGRAAASALRTAGHHITPAGRSAPDDGIAIDLSTGAGRTALRDAAADHDVVINASGVEDPRIAELLGGAVLVDASATAEYLAQLSAAVADAGASSVLGAGLAPGLSTLLVAAVASEPGDDVDLAIVLGGGETHGAAAVEWTAALAGRKVWGASEEGAVFNFRQRRRLPTGSGERSCLRADFPDDLLIGRARGVAVRSFLATDSALTTAALRLVGSFPALSRLVSRAPHLGSDQWSLTAVNRRTREVVTAKGAGQSQTTGELVALAAAMAARTQISGVVTSADLFTLDDVARGGIEQVHVHAQISRTQP